MPMTKDYNQFSDSQASVNLYLPEYINTAFQNAPQTLISPYTIVEYGCSGGKNSLLPLRNIFEKAWSTYGEKEKINVILSDLPSNDFGITMSTINSDSYLNSVKDRINIKCQGCSFYEQVVPSSSVDFGYSLVSAHFLSKIPGPRIQEDDLCTSPRPFDEKVKEMWHTQAANDWAKFLELRAEELKPNGKLFVAALGHDQSKAPLLRLALSRNIFIEMVKEGHLTHYEVDHMVAGVYSRSKEEVMNGFERVGKFNVDALEIHTTPCPYYEKFIVQGNNDVNQFAFYVKEATKAVSYENLLSTLLETRPRDKAENILEIFFSKLEKQYKQDPEKYQMKITMFYVLATKKS